MLILVVRSLLAYLMILAALRWMGKRQLGELQPSELVSTILISNLASLCIEDPSLPFLYSVIPVFLIAAAELFNSAIAFQSQDYARFLSGKPIIVVRHGIIDQKALRKLRLTTSDLLEAMRGNGIFSPQEAELAIIETDGSLSVLEKSQAAQVVFLPLIIDGCLLRENLEYLQIEEKHLWEQLALRELTLDKVLLLMSDGARYDFTKIEPDGKDNT